MTIAVTDACIFIDLIELHLLHLFFQCGWNIHTTREVFHELYPHQQKKLRIHQRKGELHIHSLKAVELIELAEVTYPRSLSHTDCTVIFIASRLDDALILSGDRVLRNFARKISVPCHGTLGIIDRMVTLALLPKSEGIKSLNRLLQSNIIYQNSRGMRAEIAKRKLAWSSDRSE